MVYVVSGYFATFHNGHKQYFDSVINMIDKKKDELIVIVANPLQFSQKYVDYVPPLHQICEPIFSYLGKIQGLKYTVMRAIDRDMTVKETLRQIVKQHKDDLIWFVKDGGEYDKENLPERDVKGITFMFMNNPKITNASEILNIKKR